jgi:hypothetical protein
MDFRNSVTYQYVDSNKIINNSSYFYTLTKAFNVLVTNSYQVSEYVVNGAVYPTLPSISNYLYQTIDHWWILGMMNNIDNLFQPIPLGTIIYWPSTTSINQYKKALIAIQSSNPETSIINELQGSNASASQTNSGIPFSLGTVQF